MLGNFYSIHAASVSRAHFQHGKSDENNIISFSLSQLLDNLF